MISVYIKEFRDKYVFEDANVIEQESDLDKVLKTSKKVRTTLIKLFSSITTDSKAAVEEVKSIVSDIRCVQKKPTVFRIVTKNGATLDLKYDPTPQQVRSPGEYDDYDSFTVIISGKRYRINIKSEYEQCLDYLSKLLGEKPILKQEEPDDQGELGQEAPEGDDETGVEKPKDKDEAK